LVGPTRSQGGVLMVVLISIPWEGVYEGSFIAETMGVDEGNKIDSLWELIKEIRWSCPVHDYACSWEISRLSIKLNVISRYRPKTNSGVGTNMRISQLENVHSYGSRIGYFDLCIKFPFNKATDYR
jgi:hypothetical protein